MTAATFEVQHLWTSESELPKVSGAEGQPLFCQDEPLHCHQGQVTVWMIPASVVLPACRSPTHLISGSQNRSSSLRWRCRRTSSNTQPKTPSFDYRFHDQLRCDGTSVFGSFNTREAAVFSEVTPPNRTILPRLMLLLTASWTRRHLVAAAGQHIHNSLCDCRSDENMELNVLITSAPVKRQNQPNPPHF